jgi:hypothetical protein
MLISSCRCLRRTACHHSTTTCMASAMVLRTISSKTPTLEKSQNQALVPASLLFESSMPNPILLPRHLRLFLHLCRLPLLHPQDHRHPCPTLFLLQELILSLSLKDLAGQGSVSMGSSHVRAQVWHGGVKLSQIAVPLAYSEEGYTQCRGMPEGEYILLTPVDSGNFGEALPRTFLLLLLL